MIDVQISYREVDTATVAEPRLPIELLHVLRVEWRQSGTNWCWGLVPREHQTITEIATWQMMIGIRTVYHVGDMVFAVDRGGSDGEYIEIIDNWAHVPDVVAARIMRAGLHWPGLEDYE